MPPHALLDHDLPGGHLATIALDGLIRPTHQQPHYRKVVGKNDDLEKVETSNLFVAAN